MSVQKKPFSEISTVIDGGAGGVSGAGVEGFSSDGRMGTADGLGDSLPDLDSD
jgi:hypothetical protein